jgi:hypothetical protein
MSTPTVRANAQTFPKPGSREWLGLAKLANCEFETLSEEELASLLPPSNDEWDQMKNPYLVTLRIGHRVVSLGKEAHMGAIAALGEESRADLFGRLEMCADRFQGLARLADEALQRLVSAYLKTQLDAAQAEGAPQAEEDA